MIPSKNYPDWYQTLPALKQEMETFVSPNQIPNKDVKELALFAREDIYGQIKK